LSVQSSSGSKQIHLYGEVNICFISRIYGNQLKGCDKALIAEPRILVNIANKASMIAVYLTVLFLKNVYRCVNTKV
jgi:hypothetical protein